MALYSTPAIYCVRYLADRLLRSSSKLHYDHQLDVIFTVNRFSFNPLMFSPRRVQLQFILYAQLQMSLAAIYHWDVLCLT